jgi:hypothetical protein
MCRSSWNPGALTFWNPQSLSRPVMGLLYLYLYLYIQLVSASWTSPWKATFHSVGPNDLNDMSYTNITVITWLFKNKFSISVTFLCNRWIRSEVARYVTDICRSPDSEWGNTNIVKCHVSAAFFYCWNVSSVLFITSEIWFEILHKILLAWAFVVIKD